MSGHRVRVWYSYQSKAEKVWACFFCCVLVNPMLDAGSSNARKHVWNVFSDLEIVDEPRTLA